VSRGVSSITGRGEQQLMEVNEETIDSQLSLGLSASNHSGKVVFSKAIALLESARQSPSCQRLATANLLSSCKDLQQTIETEYHVQELQSLYAINLAICELPVSTTPDACDFVRSNDGKRKAQSSINRNIRKCLSALESRPQWWTSYSNNNQNAMTICQAVRADVERGK
jgi:hypothetical protein